MRILSALSEFRSVFDCVQDPSLALDRHLSVGVPLTFECLWVSCDGSFDSSSGSASVGVVVNDPFSSIVAGIGKLVNRLLLLWQKPLPFGTSASWFIILASLRPSSFLIVRTS